MKTRSGPRLPRRAMLPLFAFVAIALLAVGCASSAPPSPTAAPQPAATAAKPAAAPTTAPAAPVQPAAAQSTAAPAAKAAPAVPMGKPEKTTIKIGTPAPASSLLPANIIADITAKEEGLNVQWILFNSGAAAAQGLASGSVDLSMSSLNGMVNAINAGQAVKGIYAGFDQADFDWLARPEIKSWNDVKGKNVGVSSFGSLTDFLTRYALKKHGMDSAKDVHMIQGGSGDKLFPALQAGKLDAAIIEPPFKFQAASAGLTVLGKQSTEVAPQWPKHVIYAKEQFIKDNPNTITAFLRAHVRAIRLIKSDKATAVKEMMAAFKYNQTEAEQAYDDALSGFDEKGLLPESSMPVWWDIAIAAGDAKAIMPESQLLDSTWINSFDQWAPK